MNNKSIPQALDEIQKQAEKAVEETLQQAGQRGAELAREQALFNASDSFNQAIQFHPVSEINGFVLADKPYSGYLEEGNNQKGPYIFPVRKKALRFVVNGQQVFAKRAKTHAGYAFMEHAGKQLESEFPEIFETICQKYLK